MAINILLQIFLFTTLILTASTKSFNSRIINGQDTDISDVPFQAIVMRLEFPLCSGVILNEQTIISAGYCFEMYVFFCFLRFNMSNNICCFFYEREEINAAEFQVRVGSSNRLEGGLVVNVQNIILHPKIESDPLTYNVAIVKLASSLIFNENIAAVVLPEPDNVVLPNSLATVSGFGIYDSEELLYPDK